MKVLIDKPNDIDIPSALSILSMQSASSPSEPKLDRPGARAKRAAFPSAWLTVLFFLLLCNHASADELFALNSVTQAQSDIPVMDNRLDSDAVRQLIDELNITRVGERGTTNVAQPQRQPLGWQLALDRIELGGVGRFSKESSAIQAVSYDSGYGSGYNFSDPLSQDSHLYSGWGAGVGYRFWLESGVSAIVKAGAFSWEQEAALLPVYQQKLNRESDGVSPYLGLGLHFRLSPEADVRFHWDHFEMNERGFDVIGIKLKYRF